MKNSFRAVLIGAFGAFVFGVLPMAMSGAPSLPGIKRSMDRREKKSARKSPRGKPRKPMFAKCLVTQLVPNSKATVA